MANIALANYLSTIGKIELLSSDEIAQLFAKYANGDERAKEKIIRHNLKLVVSVAKNYTSNPDAIMDLIQEGYLGLIRAVEKFDPSLGLQFSTYAVPWINCKIREYRIANCKIAKVPMHTVKLARRVSRMMQDHGMSAEEVSKALNKPMSKINAAIEVSKADASLDFTYGSDDDDSDPIVNSFSGEVNVEDDVDVEKVKRAISVELSSLPEKQRFAIIKAFGLDGNDILNGQEIADSMGLSRERVRQLIANGKNQLMDQLTRKNMSLSTFLN